MYGCTLHGKLRINDFEEDIKKLNYAQMDEVYDEVEKSVRYFVRQ